jgi:hypothetical protein
VARGSLTVYWSCLECNERGEGDSKAALHTKKTNHGTITSIIPPKAE